jgi:hypothetical protein
MNWMAALSKCRRAQITIFGGRPAASGVTRIVTNAGTTERPWKRDARPPHARIVLWGSFASVRFRQRRGETTANMVARALEELRRREREGMPKPDPRAKKRRELRKLLDSADPRQPM